jgi:hypothetical protein
MLSTIFPNTPDFFVNNLPAKLYSLANFYNLIMNVIYLAVVFTTSSIKSFIFFSKEPKVFL